MLNNYGQSLPLFTRCLGLILEDIVTSSFQQIFEISSPLYAFAGRRFHFQQQAAATFDSHHAAVADAREGCLHFRAVSAPPNGRSLSCSANAIQAQRGRRRHDICASAAM